MQKLNADAANVIHMTVRPQYIVDEEDASKGKALVEDREKGSKAQQAVDVSFCTRKAVITAVQSSGQHDPFFWRQYHRAKHHTSGTS